jgi:hypothetical protein
VYGMPIEEFCRCVGQQVSFTLQYADEARDLMQAQR